MVMAGSATDSEAGGSLREAAEAPPSPSPANATLKEVGVPGFAVVEAASAADQLASPSRGGAGLLGFTGPAAAVAAAVAAAAACLERSEPPVEEPGLRRSDGAAAEGEPSAASLAPGGAPPPAPLASSAEARPSGGSGGRCGIPPPRPTSPSMMLPCATPPLLEPSTEVACCASDDLFTLGAAAEGSAGARWGAPGVLASSPPSGARPPVVVGGCGRADAAVPSSAAAAGAAPAAANSEAAPGLSPPPPPAATAAGCGHSGSPTAQSAAHAC